MCYPLGKIPVNPLVVQPNGRRAGRHRPRPTKQVPRPQPPPHPDPHAAACAALLAVAHDPAAVERLHRPFRQHDWVRVEQRPREARQLRDARRDDAAGEDPRDALGAGRRREGAAVVAKAAARRHERRPLGAGDGHARKLLGVAPRHRLLDRREHLAEERVRRPNREHDADDEELAIIRRVHQVDLGGQHLPVERVLWGDVHVELDKLVVDARPRCSAAQVRHAVVLEAVLHADGQEGARELGRDRRQVPPLHALGRDEVDGRLLPPRVARPPVLVEAAPKGGAGLAIVGPPCAFGGSGDGRHRRREHRRGHGGGGEQLADARRHWRHPCGRGGRKAGRWSGREYGWTTLYRRTGDRRQGGTYCVDWAATAALAARWGGRVGDDNPHRPRPLM